MSLKYEISLGNLIQFFIILIAIAVAHAKLDSEIQLYIENLRDHIVQSNETHGKFVLRETNRQWEQRVLEELEQIRIEINEIRQRK